MMVQLGPLYLSFLCLGNWYSREGFIGPTVSFLHEDFQYPKYISLTLNESLDTIQPRKAQVLETLWLKFFSMAWERQGLKPNLPNSYIRAVKLILFCQSSL